MSCIKKSIIWTDFSIKKKIICKYRQNSLYILLLDINIFITYTVYIK